MSRTMTPTRRQFTAYLAAAPALPLITTGCASLSPATVKTVADVTLLEAEFEQARAILSNQPWSDAEAKMVYSGVTSLDTVRKELHRATKNSDTAALTAMNYLAGESLIDEAAGAYQTIKVAYLAMLNRTKKAPDIFLENYAASAEHVYEELSRMLPEQGGVSIVQVGGYLSYILRGYALYKSGGATSAVI